MDRSLWEAYFAAANDAARRPIINQIVNLHLPLVGRVARRVCAKRPYLHLDDAISDGQIGLLRAIKANQPAHASEFAALAITCIRGEILTGNGRRDAVRVAKRGGHLYSLDAPLGTDDGRSWLEITEGDGPPPEAADGPSLIQQLADRLPQELGRIILLCYGDGLNDAEAAAAMGTTEDHVRRQRGNALAGLFHRIEAGDVPANFEEIIMSAKKQTTTKKTKVVEVNPIDKEIEVLATLDTAELKRQLGALLELTVKHIYRICAIIRVLQDRKEKLDDFRSGLMKYLEAAAAGRLLAEAILAVSAYPKLVDKMIGKPAAVQRDIIENKEIAVVVPDNRAKNDFKVVKVPAQKLTEHMLPQVFAKNHVRTPDEQKAWLQRPAPCGRKPEPHKVEVTVDDERQGIIVKGVFLSLKELEEYVGQLKATAKKGAAA